MGFIQAKCRRDGVGGVTLRRDVLARPRACSCVLARPRASLRVPVRARASPCVLVLPRARSCVPVRPRASSSPGTCRGDVCQMPSAMSAAAARSHVHSASLGPGRGPARDISVRSCGGRHQPHTEDPPCVRSWPNLRVVGVRSDAVPRGHGSREPARSSARSLARQPGAVAVSEERGAVSLRPKAPSRSPALECHVKTPPIEGPSASAQDTVYLN